MPQAIAPIAHAESVKRPSVSIGMPVFNGAASVREAIECILCQTHTDFELLISDNCSTDQTAQICRALADADRRLSYVRQEENIGADANFRFVFEQSKSDYFMWAAADDLRSPDFLEANLKFLRGHPDYVGSTSPVRFANGSFDANAMGDAPLSDDCRFQRVLDFIRRSHANGRFYSLFHRNVVATWPHLQDSFFLGADWTMVTHAASCGKLNRCSEGWVEFGKDGMSNRGDVFKRFRKSKLDLLLPYRKMSSDILATMKGGPLRMRAMVIVKLALLNARAACLQFVIGWRRGHGRT